MMPRTKNGSKYVTYRCDFPGCQREVRGAFTGPTAENGHRLHFCSKHHNLRRERNVIRHLREERRRQEEASVA